MNDNYLNIKKLFGNYLEDHNGWVESCEMTVLDCLGNEPRKLILDGFNADSKKDEFFEAILNLQNNKSIVSEEATDALYRYFLDNYSDSDINLFTGEKFERFERDNIWNHVRIGDTVHILRRPYGDFAIYVSIESGCEWESEHGLELVLKNGEKITKLGPYNGHCTNNDAYDYEQFENTIYVSNEMNKVLLEDEKYMKKFLR